MSSLVLGFDDQAVIQTAIGAILTSFDGTTSYYLTDENGIILVIV
jgi:hypothetical protein